MIKNMSEFKQTLEKLRGKVNKCNDVDAAPGRAVLLLTSLCWERVPQGGL